MNRILLILLCSLTLFSGCAVIPPYTPPETLVPDAWPTGPAYRDGSLTDEPVAADLPWPEFYTDARLRAVIETALANNRDLRLAALNVARAQAIYGIQRSALYPALDATANGSKKRIPADISSSGESYTAKQYDVNLGILSWEIDFFGRIRSLKEQALQSYLATEEARRSARILLIASVARAYLTLAADQENLRLAQTTFENQKSAHDLIKRRQEVGLGSELDLNRARTQVDIARVDIARYTRLVAQDRNALNLLAGTLQPLTEAHLPADLASVAPLGGIGAGLSSMVLLNRPDILQAERLLKAANANIGAARAALFPRISLTTTIGTASADLHNLFTAGQDTWLFAPQVSMPIFDARLWAALDATKAEREIAITQYQKAIQTAFREVADALAVEGTVDQQLSAQKALVRSAAETYRLSDARYTKGIDSYLGVLDAQRSLYTAQQALVAMNLVKLTNQVQLYAALGGGAR
ncbi:efflux transporter outer membrane subunit [Desulfosarcina ovata]|uniref:Multidrug transporter n=1 Tax=Desulfosarcina ovata subsp. ovata TaxID=2752305 RepID=A0A5K8A4M8_9BACT|nr:efflux transporter outer membrane subunit [Desulfosarcina ovata]BBO87250.1 multidrug transporter [Desulfosarcina ovata subsp. ovata]